MRRSVRRRPTPRDVASAAGDEDAWRDAPLIDTAARSAVGVLESLGGSAAGLSSGEARRRLQLAGPNAIRSHGARPLAVLVRQLNSPLLLLLVAAALVSILVGEHADAGIILAIIGLSVGLGFANEFRSERAVEALHDRIRHTALTVRDGRPVAVDVTELVPGDLVRLGVGDVVPPICASWRPTRWSATRRCSPESP